MSNPDGLKNIETLINRFGGMRPMARKVDVAVSTVQGWKKRDHIPADRMDDVIQAARLNNISLKGVVDLSAESANENENAAQDKDNGIASESMVKPKNHASQPSAKSLPKSNQPQIPNYQLEPSYIRQQIISRSIITSLCVVGVVGGLGYFLFKDDIATVNEFTSDQQKIEAKLDQYRTDYQSFEQTVTDGLNAASDKITDIAAVVGIQRNAEGNIILANNMTLSERLLALESRLRAGGQDIDFGQIVTQFQTMAQMEGSFDPEILAQLETVVNGLQGQVQNLDVALDQAKQDNAALAQSLDSINGKDLSAAAMLLAMTQMRSSLDRQQPFADDLALMQQLIGNEDAELTAAINRLAPYAERGVLSPEGISNELKNLTGDIVTAALKGEDVSVQDKMTARLGEILSVEKDGQPVLAIEEQRIIAAAQNALEQGDTKTAMMELSKLEGEAAQAAAPVTTQVQGAVAADQAMTMLLQNLLVKLQDPQALQNMIQSIPDQINRQMQGQVKGDIESGLIILE